MEPGGNTGERLLLGLTRTSIERESYGSIDLRGSEIGRGVEVNVEGETVLILEAVDFESAKGFVGCDLGALALPLRC